jgi:hypothetical protein
LLQCQMFYQNRCLQLVCILVQLIYLITDDISYLINLVSKYKFCANHIYLFGLGTSSHISFLFNCWNSPCIVTIQCSLVKTSLTFFNSNVDVLQAYMTISLWSTFGLSLIFLDSSRFPMIKSERQYFFTLEDGTFF